MERVIASVPGVREASVVGRRDRTLDEVLVVFVTMATDDPAVVDRIEAACAGLLSDFKRPRAVKRQRD